MLRQQYRYVARFVLCMFFLFVGMGVHAQTVPNAIESIVASSQGSNIVVKLMFTRPVEKAPVGFAITNPARIALDFPNTTNATGRGEQNINIGDVLAVNVVEAAERARLVFNLKRSLHYATAIDGNAVVVTIDGSGGTAAAVNASGVPIVSGAPANTDMQLRNVDFRRGNAGEGRVVVDLPFGDVSVDVRQQGQKIVVDLLKVELPNALRRRIDVSDFGTPVQMVTTSVQNKDVRMVIEPRGVWDYSAYQNGSQLIVEVRPIKEDPNKLAQGAQGYRGDKLSLNFQNIEVRAVLQVIADFTGLNVVTSESVTGNLTLRLKDVPWDQALDIVMQAKGLDMRKSGNVLWIAPRDELLNKEKLDLEKMSQISELEPLKTEVFQLNYQKADAFKTAFGLDGDKGAKNSILSKRGSAAAEPRTNKLFVTDIVSRLNDVRALIAATDIPSRQVLIEARIVEADDTFSKDLGAKLSFGLAGTIGGKNIEASGQQTGTLNGSSTTGVTGLISTALKSVNGGSVNLPAQPTAKAAGTVALTLFNADASRFIGLELSALESDGNGKIISSPRVVTADQLPAIIEQGEELPCTQYDDKGRPTTTYKTAVLKLDVTPQITPDGSVILSVDVTKNSRGILVGSCYAVNTKHVKTNVQVENGGTVVLGGIFSQEERGAISKVPLLGDVPVFGNLFKTSSSINNKTELLIFLTPKIINDKIILK